MSSLVLVKNQLFSHKKQKKQKESFFQDNVDILGVFGSNVATVSVNGEPWFDFSFNAGRLSIKNMVQ